MVSYSLDAYKWEFARDIYGNKKVFKGNSDSHTLRHSYLEHPVKARFVRIHVVDWHGKSFIIFFKKISNSFSNFFKFFFNFFQFFSQGHPSLRMEIVGHQDCNELISEVPYADISASSHKPWHRKKSCTPDLGDISSSEGWCPKRQTSK